MQFIQHRGSGSVYYYTTELAKRDDIDIIEAPDGMTPEEVEESIKEARAKLKREAELAVAEAEKSMAVRVVKTKITSLPPGVKVERVGKPEDGNGDDH